MPFSFVISGVISLSILFGLVDIKSKLFRVVLMMCLFLYMIGFFLGDAIILNVSFNCIHLILFALLFLFVFVLSKRKLINVLRGVLFSLILFLIVSLGYKDVDIENFGFVFLLIALSSSFVSSSFFDSLLTSLVCVFSMIFVLINFALDNYTFASIDFDLAFLTFFVCILLNYIRFNSFDYKRRKLFYVS